MKICWLVFGITGAIREIRNKIIRRHR